MPRSMRTRYWTMHESNCQHIGKSPSLHLFHTAVRECMGVFLKRTTSSILLLAVHGCSLPLRPLLSSSHMAWKRGHKFTNFTAVASFSSHFLALPTWPGNEDYDSACVSVQLGMFTPYVAMRQLRSSQNSNHACMVGSYCFLIFYFVETICTSKCKEQCKN